ncbi:MAG: hypothetical protein EZS28_018205 [Streblomastix strix]|uniref:Reverse transcriptase domain-containing protein n=1 Tax=Streblomastix strix TaxID=222440 RepID=A0A5J4VUI7_9EUKA|nr:MAG: hypothetical protein EZS28_018205 [Streblomastix strix]
MPIHHIRVADEMRLQLCFSFNRHSYSYKGMLFGVSTVQGTFTKSLQSEIEEARKRCSSRIFVIVDDFLFLNQVPSILQRKIQQIMKTIEEFDWMIEMDKNRINPMQIVELLGWQWNIRSMSMQTTTSRRRGVLKQLRHLMELAKREKYVRTRYLASVIREIQYTRAQFKRVAFHNKYLQQLKDKEVVNKGWNKWNQLILTVIPKITWWIIKLAQNQPLCFTKPNKWITVQTDALSSGWGTTPTRENQQKVFAHGEQKVNKVKSSNKRDGTAILKALLELRQN